MSNVGLYLGTFNPIHNGHVTLTKYFSSLPELDEVLVVISPQSPFKNEEGLISDYERLEMAETVFKKFDNVRVSDIEFKMSRPNFTIDTLKEFKRRHKYNKLILLIGEDNLAGFNNWKDYKKMIEIAEALSPCILWVDEIDKAFAGAQSSGDSGTTSRVLATFITWLSEKTTPVFVVATANNIDCIPPEILRKGRFDEIFFVNLPSKTERTQIFTVFLNQLRPNNIENYDLTVLTNRSDGFSGAEIQQAIIEGMHFAFNEKREFTTADILNGIEQIIPLSQIDPERTKQLQDWALSGRVRLAS